ncbi:hypothetical protein DFP72DRAFT_1067773 [Ephemerocybe angulata]|uniref:Uncharacterized protein n=1 Tax=Ephemerocybe angulata TaxID=980116 RepID=A0A8H6M806_9AGAR|nr:hypothetical protein DFP72DRAFT_1067773 [Tulosesus angulatus]
MSGPLARVISGSRLWREGKRLPLAGRGRRGIGDGLGSEGLAARSVSDSRTSEEHTCDVKAFQSRIRPRSEQNDFTRAFLHGLGSKTGSRGMSSSFLVTAHALSLGAQLPDAHPHIPRVELRSLVSDPRTSEEPTFDTERCQPQARARSERNDLTRAFLHGLGSKTGSRGPHSQTQELTSRSKLSAPETKSNNIGDGLEPEGGTEGLVSDPRASGGMYCSPPSTPNNASRSPAPAASKTIGHASAWAVSNPRPADETQEPKFRSKLSTPETKSNNIGGGLGSEILPHVDGLGSETH